MLRTCNRICVPLKPVTWAVNRSPGDKVGGNAAAKIIIISGNSQKKVYEQLEKEGAAAFCPKPIKEKDLTEAIAWATRP